MSSKSSSSSINLDEISKSWKVLLVDDESDILEQAEVFLEKEDDRLNILTAVSAEEGLELMDEYKFDIIVSDYQMPSMNGLELLKVVRKEKESNIPFIMFTGKGREEVAMEALNLGTDRYLQKGGDPRSQYGVLARAIVQEVKHAEAMREKTKVEAELSSLVKGSEDPIYIVDEDCRFTFANHAELERHGLEWEELVGKRFHDLHPDRDSRKFMEKVKKTLQTGENQRQEIKHQVDGRYYVRTLSPIENPETGKVDRVSVISKDITDRMEKEKKLRESEERFRTFFEEMKDPVFVESLEPESFADILEANPAAENHTGYSREELIGMNLIEDLVKEPVSVSQNVINERLKSGESLSFTEKQLRKDGTEIWVETIVTPIEYKGEKAALSVNRDITELKEREEKLEASREEFKELINGMNDAVLVHDLEGNFLTTNDKAVERLGYSREELLSMKPQDIDAPGSDEKVRERIRNIEDDETLVFETVHVTKEGREIPVEINSSLITYQGEPAIMSVARDISKRKEMEKIQQLVTSSLDQASLEIFWINSRGKFEYANDIAKQRLGYSEEELREMNVWDVDPEYAKEDWKEQWEELKQKKVLNFETVHKNKDGKTFPVEVTSQYLEYEGEEYEFAFAKDIAERKKAERKLRESEKKYREVFTNTQGAMWIVDVNDGEFVYEEVNPKYAKDFVGLSKEEIEGKNIAEIFESETAKTISENYKKVVEEREPLEKEQYLKLPIGKKWHLITLTPILDDEGNVEKIIGSGKNTTERREAEEKYKTLFDELTDALFLEDTEGHILDVNQAACELLGYDYEELTSMSVDDLVPEGEPAFLPEEIDEATQIGEPLETVNKRKDGTPVPVELKGRIIELKGEKRMLVSVRDITERKKAEKALRKRERRFRSIVENSHEGILIVDETYDLIYVNDRLCEMLGHSRDEVIGRDFREFLDDESRELVAERYKKRQKGEEVPPRYEFNIVRKNGEKKRVEIISTVVETSQGNKRTIAQILDISEEKKAKERLQGIKERYEELFNGANELIITTDKEGYIHRINKAVEDVSGYSEEELKDESILKVAHPEDRDKYIEFWKRVTEGEEPVYQLRGVAKDGHIIHIIVGGRPITNEGEIVEIQYNAQNITDLVKTRKREEFLHSLLRHDVRNKAQIAAGYFELLREEDLSEQGREYLEKTEKACDEAVEIIEKVRKLREIEKESEIEEIELHKVFDEVIDEHEDQVSEKNIELDCEDHEQLVKGGPLLEELFSNLLENAIRHSGCDKIRIYGREQNGECIITVEDDGCGISEEERERIFERGYKKGETGGSGLGLYLVKEIAESYGGTVQVKDSELGGARFDVYLKKAN